MQDLEKKLEIFFENPTQESFNELEKTGTLALLLVAEKGEYSFFNCDHWRTIYYNSSGGLQALAFQKISELVKDKPLDEWKEFYSSSSRHLQGCLCRWIEKQDKNLDEWKEFYSKFSGDEWLKKLAFRKIKEFMKTFDECKEFFFDSSGDVELQKLALREMYGKIIDSTKLLKE